MAYYIVASPGDRFIHRRPGRIINGRQRLESLSNFLDLAGVGQLSSRADPLLLTQNYATPLDLLFTLYPQTDCQPSTRDKLEVSDTDKFLLSMDVNHFTPDELSVKIVDNSVIVHGKHEERQDEHGYVSREFTRRYGLPEGVLAENVQSSLTRDGLLIIEAPKLVHLDPPSVEKVVPISIKSQPEKELETSEDKNMEE